MWLIYFDPLDHLGDKVVEYRILALGTVDPEAEFIEVPVQVITADPGIGRPYPGFHLVDHCVERFEVHSLFALYLGNVVSFCYGPVALHLSVVTRACRLMWFMKMYCRDRAEKSSIFIAYILFTLPSRVSWTAVTAFFFLPS